MPDHYNVLFVCTGNSARSIMAEAILNFRGKPRFTAYSAGSHPSGTVRPEALQQLKAARIPVDGLRSKSWDEFSKPGSPKLNFVFTVCDNAAKEACPLWHPNPGTANDGALAPKAAHWGVPDPAAVKSGPDEAERAFREAFIILDRRISLFLSLPIASIEKLTLQKELDQIGLS
jgi:arsenate reductase